MQQDVAENVTQGVAEDVVGAAEDGSVKVIILPIAIFQRRNHAQRSMPPPKLPLGDT